MALAVKHWYGFQILKIFGTGCRSLSFMDSIPVDKEVIEELKKKMAVDL